VSYNIHNYPIPANYRELFIDEKIQEGDIYYAGDINYVNYCSSTIGFGYNKECVRVKEAIGRQYIILTKNLTPPKPPSQEEIKNKIINDTRRFVENFVPNYTTKDLEYFVNSEINQAYNDGRLKKKNN